MGKKLIVTILAALVFIVSTGNQVAYANSSTDPLFRVNYGDYQDENVFYSIDFIDTTELEEEGFWDKFKIFSNLADGVVGFFYNLLHQIFVDLPFFMLKAMTTAMIWIFNKIYEVNFVNAIVEEIATTIQSIAGISAGNFSSSGLFGGFLGLVTISIAIYTLYQFIVKRASISAFSGLLKSLTALVLAIVFFSNYSTIIKGLNTLSVETSSLIISGSANVSNGNISDDSAQDQMNTALWNTFVHQPYLMLQYGSMDQNSIGENRILNLLQKKPDTEERYNLVKEEVLDRGNEMMTRGKIFERWGILMIAFVANFFNSIPVMILAFALLFFQFWFTVMAMIAPFVFIWSAFPNQFGVLARYLLELITPLVLKIAVAVLALIVFSLTGIISSVAMNTLNTSGLLAYIFLVFVEGILFFTLFLLRKRIFNIFSMGSRQLAHVRENMSSAFVQPTKKGVQNTATAVGTVAGAMSGGVQGAMVGSSMGSSIGSALTGDKSIGDAGRDVALNYSLYENMQNRKALDEMQQQNQKEREQNELMSQQERNQRLNALSQGLQNSGLSDDVIQQTHEELEKRGLHDISPQEMQTAFNEVKAQAEKGSLNKTFAKEFANQIQSSRLDHQIANEKEMMIKSSDIQTSDISIPNDGPNNDTSETTVGTRLDNLPNETRLDSSPNETRFDNVTNDTQLDSLNAVLEKDIGINNSNDKKLEVTNDIDKFELDDYIDNEKEKDSESEAR